MKWGKINVAALTLFGALLFGGEAKAGVIWIEPWDYLSVPYNSFFIEHNIGYHEQFVEGEDVRTLLPPSGPYINTTSSPYPYDTPLGVTKINKESTFPIDITVKLTGQASADGDLYVQITDANGYEHRNLTIQEIPDACNPDDPLNPNPEYDIRDRQNNHGGQVPGSGDLQEGMPRYWRIRVYSKLRGDIDENGQIDPKDLGVLSDRWLNDTYVDDEYVGNNYDVSDRNHDGFTDFLDFAIMAKDWLEEE